MNDLIFLIKISVFQQSIRNEYTRNKGRTRARKYCSQMNSFKLNNSRRSLVYSELQINKHKLTSNLARQKMNIYYSFINHSQLEVKLLLMKSHGETYWYLAIKH